MLQEVVDDRAFLSITMSRQSFSVHLRLCALERLARLGRPQESVALE